MNNVVSLRKEEMSDIRQKMIRWELWRDVKRREMLVGLDYGETMIGKCLDGMPTTICNLCRGHDDECPRCEGSGRITMQPEKTKVNPAFIASTHKSPDDETSEKIDRIMCRLRAKQKTLGYYLILLQEYTRIGTRQMKAQRIHLTYGAYKVKLHRAHQAVEDGLGINKCNQAVEHA